MISLRWGGQRHRLQGTSWPRRVWGSWRRASPLQHCWGSGCCLYPESQSLPRTSCRPLDRAVWCARRGGNSNPPCRQSHLPPSRYPLSGQATEQTPIKTVPKSKLAARQTNSTTLFSQVAQVTVLQTERVRHLEQNNLVIFDCFFSSGARLQCFRLEQCGTCKNDPVKFACRSTTENRDLITIDLHSKIPFGYTLKEQSVENVRRGLLPCR